MVFRIILAEIFQRRKRPGLRLYLVEQYQRSALGYRFSGQRAQRGDYPVGIQVLGKNIAQTGHVFEIEIRGFRITTLAELQQRISLPRLPRAEQHQRLSPGRVFP